MVDVWRYAETACHRYRAPIANNTLDNETSPKTTKSRNQGAFSILEHVSLTNIRYYL